MVNGLIDSVRNRCIIYLGPQHLQGEQTTDDCLVIPTITFSQVFLIWRLVLKVCPNQKHNNTPVCVKGTAIHGHTLQYKPFTSKKLQAPLRPSTNTKKLFVGRDCCKVSIQPVSSDP